MTGWGVLLNGVLVGSCGSTECLTEPPTEVGFLTAIPDGLGMADLRTETVAFGQRDGARMFSDWFEQRILTFEAAVCPDTCPTCPAVREQVAQIMAAWDRTCGETELVLFTDCAPGATAEDRALTGPFGVTGRPRGVQLQWDATGCASLILRFDAIDHRLYVLDECGNPGSGEVCNTLQPGIPEQFETCMPFCFTTELCFDTPTGGEPGVGAVVDMAGSECACATITLTGQLTDPVVTVQETGQTIGYSGVIGVLDAPVIINGADGTATQGGQSVTHLLTGDATFCLPTDSVTLVLTSQGLDDTGTAEVCARPTTGWA
jgi:hypothetical protein